MHTPAPDYSPQEVTDGSGCGPESSHSAEQELCEDALPATASDDRPTSLDSLDDVHADTRRPDADPLSRFP